MIKIHNIRIIDSKCYPGAIILETSDSKLISLVTINKKMHNNKFMPLYAENNSQIMAFIISSSNQHPFKNLASKITEGAIAHNLLSKDRSFQHRHTLGYYKVFPHQIESLLKTVADITYYNDELECLIKQVNNLEKFNPEEVKKFYSHDVKDTYYTNEFKEDRLNLSDEKLIIGTSPYHQEPHAIPSYPSYTKMFDSNGNGKTSQVILAEINEKTLVIAENAVSFLEGINFKLKQRLNQKDLLKFLSSYQQKNLELSKPKHELNPEQLTDRMIFLPLFILGSVDNLSLEQLKTKEKYLIEQKTLYSNIIQEYTNLAGGTNEHNTRLSMVSEKIEKNINKAKLQAITEIPIDYDIEWLKSKDTNYQEDPSIIEDKPGYPQLREHEKRSVSNIAWLNSVTKPFFSDIQKGADMVYHFLLFKQQEINDLEQVQKKLRDLRQNQYLSTSVLPQKRKHLGVELPTKKQIKFNPNTEVHIYELGQDEKNNKKGLMPLLEEQPQLDNNPPTQVAELEDNFEIEPQFTEPPPTISKPVTTQMQATPIAPREQNYSPANFLPNSFHEEIQPIIFNDANSVSAIEVPNQTAKYNFNDKFLEVKNMTPEEFKVKIGVEKEMFEKMVKELKSSCVASNDRFRVYSPENEILILLFYYRNKQITNIKLADEYGLHSITFGRLIKRVTEQISKICELPQKSDRLNGTGDIPIKYFSPQEIEENSNIINRSNNILANKISDKTKKAIPPTYNHNVRLLNALSRNNTPIIELLDEFSNIKDKSEDEFEKQTGVTKSSFRELLTYLDEKLKKTALFPTSTPLSLENKLLVLLEFHRNRSTSLMHLMEKYGFKSRAVIHKIINNIRELLEEPDGFNFTEHLSYGRSIADKNGKIKFVRKSNLANNTQE